MPFCGACGAPSETSAPCPACGFDPAPLPVRTLTFRCEAQGFPLLVLCLKTLLLSILTLGIYSFWGRTEIKRYLHHETFAGEDRFAWHGTPRELLIGWLKGMAILIVFYGIFFALTLTGSEWVRVGAVVFLYFGILGLVPLIIVGSQRYRLSRTSLRGIRFSSTARLGEFYKLYFKGIGLTLVTFGFYSPYFANNLYAYLTRNSKYGDENFAYDGKGGELLGSYIAAIFLLLPTLYTIMFWYLARQTRHFYNHTTFQQARFECTIRGRQILWLMFSNAFLIVITLGIYYPWAVIRAARLAARTVRLSGYFDLDKVRQRIDSQATATGEEIGAVLDVDADIGGAFGL